jgi:YYY domain-containing protein
MVSRLCGSLEDKGYSVSKIVGLIFLTFISWMLSSLHILPFGYANIAVSIIILAAVSFAFGKKNLRISQWPRRNIVISEIVFTMAFVALVLLQFGKADISYSGNCDALFNYAFIQSILRGGYSPPLDPWFAGGTIPYYYGGHYLIAFVTKFTGVPPSVAFNIAMAMLYAFAMHASYGLLYNITKRKLYGLVAVLFVCIIGYTSGAFQLVAHITQQSVLGYPPIGGENIIDWMLSFDFWTAPWLINGAITHYAGYSFLMSDMHTYFMSIPFQIAYISLVFAVFKRSLAGERLPRCDVFLIILVLSLCLGFFFFMNTWEYPTYIILTAAAFILMKPLVSSRLLPCLGRLKAKTSRMHVDASSQRRADIGDAEESCGESTNVQVTGSSRISVLVKRMKPLFGLRLFIPLAVTVLSFVLYLPYYLSSKLSGFHGIGIVPTELRTSLAELLEYCAPFLFILITFLLVIWKREFFAGEKALIVAGLVLVSIVLIGVFLHFHVLIVAVPVLLLCIYFLWKSKQRTERDFVFLLAIMGIAIVFSCELFYINDIFSGQWERFNSIMKIYHQVWIFLAISASAGMYYAFRYFTGKKKALIRVLKAVWLAILAVMLIAAFVHPVAMTTSLIGGRHEFWGDGRGTLDGFAFIEEVNKGDYEAIKWLNDNVAGHPVILEMPGEQWSYSSRVSGYTGLPTVIGWQGNFEKVWGRNGSEVDTRAGEADLIYNTLNNDEALELLQKYNVEYIYIGTLEQNKYSIEGLQKFDSYSGSYELIYQYEGVSIYRLKED